MLAFSDESRFCLGMSDGLLRFWKKSGNYAYLDGVWKSYLSKEAVSYCSRSRSVEVVPPALLPFFASDGNVVFRQDNAGSHRIKLHSMVPEDSTTFVVMEFASLQSSIIDMDLDALFVASKLVQ